MLPNNNTVTAIESYRLVSRQRDILIMPGYCMAGTLRNGGGQLMVSTVQRRSWYLYWRELWLYSSTPLMTICLRLVYCMVSY